MTIKIVSREKAGTLNYPLSNMVPCPDSDALYSGYKQTLSKSKTAMKIISQLDTLDNIIGLLISNNAPDCTYTPPSCLKLSDYGFDGGLAIVNPDLKITFSVGKEYIKLPSEISLVHELGHAFQYLILGNPYKKYLDEWTIGVDAWNKVSMSVENPNVKEHEAPVCKELKLPYWRVGYA